MLATTTFVSFALLVLMPKSGATTATSAPILLHLNNQCSVGSRIFNLSHTVEVTADHGASKLGWTISKLKLTFNESCLLHDVVTANQQILSSVSTRSFFVGPQVTPVCPLTDTVASYTPELISVAWVCWRHLPKNDVFSIYPSTLKTRLEVLISVLKFFKFSNIAILYQFDFNWYPFAQKAFSVFTNIGFKVRLLENYATVGDTELTNLKTDQTKGKMIFLFF